MIKDIALSEFESAVLDSPLPVLLDFWAPWCGPCKALAPQLEKLAVQHDGRLTILKLNVDEHEEATARFGLRGFPTLLGFVEGQEVLRKVGVPPGTLQAIAVQLLKPEGEDEGLQSFFGREELRARCVAWLRDHVPRRLAIDSQREAEGGAQSASQSAGAAQGELHEEAPSLSAELERYLGGDYPGMLGLPAYVAVLHDEVFRLGKNSSDTAHSAVQFMEQIPLGADLRGHPETLAVELLYRNTWSIVPTLRKCLSSAEGVLDELESAHLSMGSGGEVHNWAAIAARLRSAGTCADQTGGELIEMVSGFCKPLEKMGPLDIQALIEVTVTAQSMATSHLWWTDEEKSLLDGFQEEISKIYRRDGDAEQLTESQIASLHEAAEERSNHFWSTYPGLLQRQRELSAARTECESAVGQAIARAITALFKG